MTITKLTFYILLLLVWAAYYIVPQKHRWKALLAGSIIFYASFGWLPLAVLICSSLITYVFGRVLSTYKNKLFFALSIAVTLAPIVIARTNIIALVGVSFYTFSSISYIAESFQGKLEPQKNYGKFLLYISFFPHIVEGPIARYNHLSKQLYEGNDFNYEDNLNGMFLILWGIIKKLVVAERIGLVVNTLFENETYYSTIYVIMAALLYAIQLYIDFSGYVNIAEGVALMFSIRLDKNFHTPYFSKSISEFWRNWHATLGEWLRDFVYIPLGGNRKGTLRKCANVFIVFLISGLWHGTAWTFVLWGVYHGILSVIDTLIKQKWTKINSVIRTIITFALVCFGWIFFRATSLSNAFSMICGLFKFEMIGVESLKVLARNSAISMYEGKILGIFLIFAIIVEMLEYRKKITPDTIKKVPTPIVIAVLTIMLVTVICFSVQGGGAFLYEVF